MYPDRLRIGLGFEFTEKEHGMAKEVTAAFTRFHHAVRKNRAAFERMTNQMPLEMEFAPGRRIPGDLIRMRDVVDTILDPPRAPTWLFIGRMLRIDVDEDRNILTNGTALGGEVERIFTPVRPWWESANKS